MTDPTPSQQLLAAEGKLAAALSAKTNRTPAENILLEDAGELIADLTKAGEGTK